MEIFADAEQIRFITNDKNACSFSYIAFESGESQHNSLQQIKGIN